MLTQPGPGPDLVYPTRPGANEELRFSLRAACANLPHRGVFVAGGRPAWLTTATHIPTDPGPHPFFSAARNLRAAVHDDRVGAVFLLMNDDFFVVDRVSEMPLQHRGLLRDLLPTMRDDVYRRGAENTVALLHRWGVPDPASYELHMPLLVVRDAARELYARLDAEHLTGPIHWRTVYANLYSPGGECVPDVKVRDMGAPIPPGRFVSTSDETFAFGLVGRQLRALFPTRSAFESTTKPLGEEAMAYYRNVTTGMVVQDTAGKLAGLARWQLIEPPADTAPDGADAPDTPPAADEGASEADEPAEEPVEADAPKAPRSRAKKAE